MSINVSAQHGFVISPRFDYESSVLLDNDLNDFYSSYNAYYAGVIPQPFDTINPGDFSHAAYGGAIRYFTPGTIGFQTGLFVTYGKQQVQRKALFQNGIGSQTDWEVRDLNLQYDLGLSIYQFLNISAHIAGRFRNTELAFGYMYQDGSYSLGNEYDILGVYSASTTTLDFGWSVGIKIKRVYVQMGMSYPSNAFSDDGLLTLMDFDERQIRWTDLPRDYTTWANDPTNLDLDNGFVRAMSLRSRRFNIGFEILLF